MSASIRARVSVFFSVSMLLAGCGGPQQDSESYVLEVLVDGGSPFHGVHGLRFDDQDRLYAVSVIGQSVFRVDTNSGDIERVVGPPQGMADDLAFAPDGTLVWTAIEDGIVYARAPDGSIRHLMEDQRGVNAVSFSPDGKRLFVTLVFYGDALYELDLAGNAPPRLIREGMGGLNAFQVGNDGMIYGPLVFGARVVRIDPDSGEMTTISDDFVSAGALKLESENSALVLDDGHKLKRVVLSTGATTTVAELPYGADNLAIDSGGRVFVSLSEVNAIAEVDVDTGEVVYAVEPAPLTSATGLGVYTSGQRDTIFVGDLFGGVKRIDGATGEIEQFAVDIFQPAHISISGDHVVVAGEVFGEVQILDRASFSVLRSWSGLSRVGDAIETSSGDAIVAETGAGRVIRLTGADSERHETLADGLVRPVGLAAAGEDAVFVTDAGAGRLLRIGLDEPGAAFVAEGLSQPEGIAVDAAGRVLVVEVGARRLIRVDPETGEKVTVAANLPIGLSNGPSLYRGVAVGSAGIYLNSDVDNSIYRLVMR